MIVFGFGMRMFKTHLSQCGPAYPLGQELQMYSSGAIEYLS